MKMLFLIRVEVACMMDDTDPVVGVKEEEEKAENIENIEIQFGPQGWLFHHLSHNSLKLSFIPDSLW